MNRLTTDWNEEKVSLDMLLDVKGDFQRLKEITENTFDENCETRL